MWLRIIVSFLVAGFYLWMLECMSDWVWGHFLGKLGVLIFLLFHIHAFNFLRKSKSLDLPPEKDRLDSKPASERLTLPMAKPAADKWVAAEATMSLKEKERDHLPPDHVSFSVTSRRSLEPGVAEEVNVWAHLAAQKEEMLKRAREQHETATPAVKSTGPVRLARDSVLHIALTVKGAEVMHEENMLEWLGELANATFLVTVPEDCAQPSLPAEVVIRCEGLIISRIVFTLKVGKDSRQAAVQAEGVPVRRVFASYATADQDAVTARLQGMKKVLPDLDVFMDLTHLRSGDVFNNTLREEILSRDMLYLFWSQAAAKSKWVDWEWRCAWTEKGEGSVDPVPLQPADEAPPPDLLKHLNFNDLYLMIRRRTPNS